MSRDEKLSEKNQDEEKFYREERTCENKSNGIRSFKENDEKSWRKAEMKQNGNK